MILKIKCECGTINIIEANTKMIHREINKEESALLGDEMLEIEEQIMDKHTCRVCEKRLVF